MSKSVRWLQVLWLKVSCDSVERKWPKQTLPVAVDVQKFVSLSFQIQLKVSGDESSVEFDQAPSLWSKTFTNK